MKPRIAEVVEPIAYMFPEYHPDAADINEALDHGVASCAVRAYAGTLLLREAFPNKNLYSIDFGYSVEHGGDFHGTNGTYLKMGHAVARLWVPSMSPVIIESYSDSGLEVVEPNNTHDDFVWREPDEGYLAYLALAQLDDIEVDSQEILKLLKANTQQS